MFDQYKPFEEGFKVGDTFTLQDAKLGAKLNTKHGESQQVLFKIGGEWFSAFGQGFVAQVGRMEQGDLPREVEYVQQPPKRQGDNPTKILWPTGTPKSWEG